jgi:hypothetical protein
MPGAVAPVRIDVPAPSYRATRHGDMDEDSAAVYLSWRMRALISPRTLRHWRAKRIGPVWNSGPGGRPIWYRQGALDEWLEITCAVDPLEDAA